MGMIIRDVDGNEITDPDLTAGYLNVYIRDLKEGAVPIDGDSTYTEDDYDSEAVYISYTNEELIDQLKAQLASTDYIAAKIAEGSATVEDYADVIEQRRTWRTRIHELENR